MEAPSRSRPPKRTHRRSHVRDYSFKAKGKANLRAIAEIIASPQSKSGLRSSDSAQDDIATDNVQAHDETEGNQDAAIAPRRLIFPETPEADIGSASGSASSDQQPETSTPNKKMKIPIAPTTFSSDEGPLGPLGLAEVAIRTEGEDSQNDAANESLDESTGDTINDDITDCRFSSEDASANNNAKTDQESTSQESTSDEHMDDNDEDEQRYGSDDTRDGGPYETTKVHMSESQMERERQDEHVLNLNYPEIYWCSWCSKQFTAEVFSILIHRFRATKYKYHLTTIEINLDRS